MKEKILEILNEIRPEADYVQSNNFIEDELLDSFDLAALLGDIEDTFKINIPGEELNKDNFINIDSITKLIKKYSR